MLRNIANFIHILDIISPYNASIETRKPVKDGKCVASHFLKEGLNMYNDYDSFYRPTQRGGEEPAGTSPYSGGEGPVMEPQPENHNHRQKKHRGLKITAIVLACVVAVGGAFGVGYAARNIFPAQQAEVNESVQAVYHERLLMVNGCWLMVND